MSETVHILATCRNPALVGATLLVFRTLRVGFKTANVYVWGNKLQRDVEGVVKKCCEATGSQFMPLESERSHDAWVETILEKSPEPFWICDTDMVFFDCVEGFGTGLMAGRYEPGFVEPWSKTHKAARLHTSLLWFNAPALRNALTEWIRRWHPKGFPFAPETTFVRQTYVPQGADRPPLFYDTCAGIYQAVGGTMFTGDQNKAFEHLHCGVYADKISVALPGIQSVHGAVFDNIEAARGLREQQDKFYAENAITK